MFVLNFIILQMRAIQSSHFVIPSARKTDTPRNHVFFDVSLRDLQLEPSHRDAQRTVCEAIFSLERRQIRVSNARRNWPSEVKPGRMECEGWKNDEKRQGSIVAITLRCCHSRGSWKIRELAME